MKFEIPEFKRCCFCVPLRYGLLVWSYLLLVPLLYIGLALGYNLFRSLLNYYSGWALAWQLTFVTLLLAAIGNTVLLIVAAHKKSSSLLKIYYVSAFWTTLAIFILIFSNLLYMIVISLEYGFHMHDLRLWRVIGALIVMLIIYLVMQLYIIVLVKSEITKLESNHSFRYVNNAEAAESAYGQLCGYIPQPEHDTQNTEVDKQTEKNMEENKEEEDNVRIYIDVADI